MLSKFEKEIVEDTKTVATNIFNTALAMKLKVLNTDNAFKLLFKNIERLNDNLTKLNI